MLGADASRFEAAAARMDAAAKRNNAAKAAIESALFDAVGRTLGVPAVQLLGGVVRERMPVFWTLASGDPAQEIEEAEAKLAARLHDRFKIKIGAQPLADDLARLRRIAAALEGRATLIVDANQAWDEATAVRAMPALADMGVAAGRAAAAGLERRGPCAGARPLGRAGDGRRMRLHAPRHAGRRRRPPPPTRCR